MRVASFKSFALATSLAIPMAATAQYGQGAQTYNPQDQQNYGAQQSYGQQSQYAEQQGQYDQQSYPDNGQEAVNQAPPPLPEYEQPPAPGDGYIWTPGYWAFGAGGYYWVPGAGCCRRTKRHFGRLDTGATRQWLLLERRLLGR